MKWHAVHRSFRRPVHRLPSFGKGFNDIGCEKSRRKGSADVTIIESFTFGKRLRRHLSIQVQLLLKPEPATQFLQDLLIGFPRVTLPRFDVHPVMKR